MITQVDHIVVAADSLEQGRQWCLETLGVAPVTGGRHALMGTHNLLANLSCEAFERCYLEIIAIDPEAPHPGRPRWFGLDERSGPPTLAGWAVRSTALAAQRQHLIDLGIDPGEQLELARGDLQWQMLINKAARLPGVLPMLLAWGPHHPTDRLPASGLRLVSVEAQGVSSDVARTLDLQGGRLTAQGPARLQVQLATPGGPVVLQWQPQFPAITPAA